MSNQLVYACIGYSIWNKIAAAYKSLANDTMHNDVISLILIRRHCKTLGYSEWEINFASTCMTL